MVRLVIGRCQEYRQLSRTNRIPVFTIDMDCNELWKKFKSAWAGKDNCQVVESDFKEFFSLIHNSKPVDDRVGEIMQKSSYKYIRVIENLMKVAQLGQDKGYFGVYFDPPIYFDPHSVLFEKIRVYHLVFSYFGRVTLFPRTIFYVKFRQKFSAFIFFFSTTLI